MSEALGTWTRRSPTGWVPSPSGSRSAPPRLETSRPLAGLRRRLGRDRFRAAALASGLDEQSAGNLMEMLDQQEEEAAGK